MRNLLVASAFVLALTGSALADPHHRHHRGHGHGWVPWVAGGAALGIIGGAVIANQPQRCWTERREVWDRFNRFIGYQDVRVCR